MQPDEKQTVCTSWTLIGRLKDADDDDAWREFYDLYSRMVLSVALKAGLRQHEAEEVVQETISSVSKHIQTLETNPARGSFRSWLLQMARWRMTDQFRKRLPIAARKTPHATRTTDTVERLPDLREADLEKLWDAEWLEQMMERAYKQLQFEVKAEHYQVFHLLTVEKKSAGEVARMLDRSHAHIYLVKHRVGRVLNKIVRRLEEKLG
jgi:RNA polymerase sigma factor (sigma-70 family)